MNTSEAISLSAAINALFAQGGKYYAAPFVADTRSDARSRVILRARGGNPLSQCPIEDAAEYLRLMDAGSREVEHDPELRSVLVEWLATRHAAEQPP